MIALVDEVEAQGSRYAAAIFSHVSVVDSIPAVKKWGEKYVRDEVETYNPPSQKIAAMETFRRVGMWRVLMTGIGKQSTVTSKTKLMHATASANAE